MDHKDRDGRDAAGIGPYARERERLVPMSTLESWTLSNGDPDIRGWEVRTVSGRQLGSVSDLLVDQAEGEVVLLDVDLPGTDQHTFVPIRVVALDRPGRLVLMDSADLLTEPQIVERVVEVTPQQLADSAELIPVVTPTGDRRLTLRRGTDRQITDVG
jgi:hypothetical protein